MPPSCIQCYKVKIPPHHTGDVNMNISKLCRYCYNFLFKAPGITMLTNQNSKVSIIHIFIAKNEYKIVQLVKSLICAK